MNRRNVFILAGIGLIVGLISAYLFSRQPPAQKPVFNPAPNPYAQGIYAQGIIESLQSNGENINIFPEVSGPVTTLLVHEGDSVKKGAPLLTIDDSVQRATYEQQRAQAEAAATLLAELKAQPRKETLDVAAAQLENAKATLANAADALAKRMESYKLDPQSISKDALDAAKDAEAIARTNLSVVDRQFTLTKAGAWSYDIDNQERQAVALAKAAAAAQALLEKYTLRAPSDGVVLAIGTAVGSYVSTAGAYDTYTQGMQPPIVMGAAQDQLAVRCYIDEILIHRLPEPAKLTGTVYIQGTDIHLPLTFERMQPYVSPKIELSDQRQERVDVRVLPLIFRFDKPKDLQLYPGQLVDVYVAAQN